MHNDTGFPGSTYGGFVAGLALVISGGSLFGQTNPVANASATTTATNWTTAQDHRNMMEQLGITKLRPGRNGNPNATNNPANYNPEKANPFPDWPEALTLKNGQKVTSAEMWWKQRRPEIVEDFEREVIGRVPQDLPKVTWQITSQAVDRVVGKIPVIAKQLVGHVDNSAHLSINVEIQMTLVTPKDARGPVPVLMMFGGFGGGGFGDSPLERRRGRRGGD